MTEEPKEIIKDEELDQVSGGTFDINKYTEETYNSCGIKTEYHFFAKDEFFIWSDASGGWVSISYDKANRYVFLNGEYRYCGYRKTLENYERIDQLYYTDRSKFYH